MTSFLTLTNWDTCTHNSSIGLHKGQCLLSCNTQHLWWTEGQDQRGVCQYPNPHDQVGHLEHEESCQTVLSQLGGCIWGKETRIVYLLFIHSYHLFNFDPFIHYLFINKSLCQHVWLFLVIDSAPGSVVGIFSHLPSAISHWKFPTDREGCSSSQLQ